MGAQLELIASEPPATRATSASGGEREKSSGKRWKVVERSRKAVESTAKCLEALESVLSGASGQPSEPAGGGRAREEPALS